MLRGNVTGMSGMLYGTVTLDKSKIIDIQSKCLKIWPLLVECYLQVGYFSIYLDMELRTNLLHSDQSHK